MSATLLPDEVRTRLPPLYGQRAETDPLVYARLFVPGTSVAWYVTECSPEGEEFVLYALAVDETGERSWEYVTLSAVEAFRSPSGIQPARDIDFNSVPASAVVARLEAERSSVPRLVQSIRPALPKGRTARFPCVRCGSKEIIGRSTCALCGATGLRRTSRGTSLG